MLTSEKLQRCRGCHDDFYNDRSPNGRKCWSLENAALVTRYAIGYWTPMDTARNLREVKVLDCYHESGSGRTVYLHSVPDHLRAEWEQLQRARRIESATSVGAVDPHVGESNV